MPAPKESGVMQAPQFLPEDINVEILLSYLKEGQCKVTLNGLHKRNSYNDIIETEELTDGSMVVSVGRLSLYNSLPEYMFHPVDRFDNLPKYEEKERFQEELDKQQEEIKNAFGFFAPIDLLLLKLRADVRSKLQPFCSDDIIMQQIIGDELTPEQRANRFIRQLLSFLPQCKYIRGNHTLITLMLRKVFMEEGLFMESEQKKRTFSDASPRYEQQLDMELGEGYVGNIYDDMLTVYTVYYWSDDVCGNEFLKFIDEVEQLRFFIKDYFLSVEEDIRFNITHDDPPLRLSDEVFYNYLNYNTNI